MPKKLNRDEIRADIQRQVRQMGAEDYFAGDSECPFGEKSLAAIHWREGFTEAERFPMFHLEATRERKTDFIQR